MRTTVKLKFKTNSSFLKLPLASVTTLCFAVLCSFSGTFAVTIAAGPAKLGKATSSAVGTWHGESICVGNRPACKNEEVVYRVEEISGKAGVVTLLADKIIDGKREPMGKLELQYDEVKGSLAGEFTRGQTHGLWQFQVTGDTMEGTLVILPDKSVGRRVKASRISEDKLPPAPDRTSYE